MVTLARAQHWITRSPDRVMPPCPHFGACGGCALQHWAETPYLAWKTDLLRHALHGAGYTDPPLLPIVLAQPHERRRIDLAFRRTGRAVMLGLHRSGNHDIVDMRTCDVLHPRLQAILDPLRALLAGLPAAGASGTVLVNLVSTGPDIAVRADAMPDPAGRARIADFARSYGVSRVHWARGKDVPEAICVLDRAIVGFANVDVAAPPEAFMQATPSGEAAIVAAVIAALPAEPHKSTRILELYAGCGTLTFPLARLATVTAYEGNAAAVAALKAAANQGMAGRIAAHHRDLARQPLTTRELAGFSAIVLDPPWTGAAMQIVEIGKSAIRRVIYVSCNPAALRRDAEVLRRAGFTLSAATPIDQFLWSAQLEAVAVFIR